MYGGEEKEKYCKCVKCYLILFSKIISCLIFIVVLSLINN